MRLMIESTDEVVRQAGLELPVWRATTELGLQFEVLVHTLLVVAGSREAKYLAKAGLPFQEKAP